MRQAAKQQRRQAILDAAQATFAAKGYDITTMEEIRAASDVSKGTLYLYFASKEALFAAVAARIFDAMVAGFEAQLAADSSVDAADQVQRLLLGLAQSLQAGDQLRGLYADFFVQAWRSDAVRAVLLSAYARTTTLFEGVIQRGIDQGTFVAVDANTTARVMLGALDGILLQTLLDPTLGSEAAIEQLAAMVLATLRGGTP